MKHRTHPKDGVKKLKAIIRDLKAQINHLQKEIAFLQKESLNIIDSRKDKKIELLPKTHEDWRKDFLDKFKKEVLNKK